MELIWITGAKGFIGRYLSKYLSEKGYRVYGIGHGRWAEKDCFSWGVSGWLNGDITASNLGLMLQQSGIPGFIFHLAGGSSVGPSFDHPLEDYRRTVDTTSRLLDWVRQSHLKAHVVCVSSAAVYGTSHECPIGEDEALQPYSPYGYHKAMMENLCQLYAHSFGLNMGIARLFSVYGPGLEKQLLWDLGCRLISDGSRLVLGGTGKEQRDWLHVTDAVRLLWIVAKLADAGCPVFNGGTGKGTTVRDIVRLVTDAWGSGCRPSFSGMSRPGDPKYLVADIQKIQNRGFVPKIDLIRGIYETVLYNKEKLAGAVLS
jgi:UDP-glucose 4-epimerase